MGKGVVLRPLLSHLQPTHSLTLSNDVRFINRATTINVHFKEADLVSLWLYFSLRIMDMSLPIERRENNSLCCASDILPKSLPALKFLHSLVGQWLRGF